MAKDDKHPGQQAGHQSGTPSHTGQQMGQTLPPGTHPVTPPKTAEREYHEKDAHAPVPTEPDPEVLRLKKRVEELEAKEAAQKSTASETPSVPPATGRQLLDSLIGDGTPPKVLTECETWLKEPDNKDASAESLYRHMEAHGCDGAEGRPSQGTLRKACKFTFGDGAEPDTLVSQSAGEELTRLRSENETLRKSLEQSNNQRSVVVKQLDIANEVKNDAVRKLAILKGGKSKQELAEMGITD